MLYRSIFGELNVDWFFFSETEWHFDLINYVVLNGQLYVGCQGKLLLGFACVFFNLYLYIFNHLYINISQVCQ